MAGVKISSATDQGVLEWWAEPASSGQQFGPSPPSSPAALTGGTGPGILTLTAGENISAYLAVVCIGGQAFKADAATIGHAGRVIGIATSSALVGDPITVQVIGLTVNAGYTFTPGEPVFLGIDGALTHTPGVGVFEQQMGVALAMTQLCVDLAEVIVYA